MQAKHEMTNNYSLIALKQLSYAICLFCWLNCSLPGYKPEKLKVEIGVYDYPVIVLENVFTCNFSS